MKSLKSIFQKFSQVETAGVSGEFWQKEPELSLKLAAGVVLLEVVHADGQVDPDEMDHLKNTLQSMFEVKKEDIDVLLDKVNKERDASIDMWRYTKVINDHFDIAQKILIVEAIWRIIFADGHVDRFEEYLVRKVSNLLHVPHADMIEAKIKSRQDILKPDSK